ncbi:actin cytoskeleton-regulatory complex protein pan1 [Hippocampus comes]|uniref:actin cytoskeleton-regulatory complex protein pan1 n=1 Tax=Hippocampus comes TaxID=109280 RepID=UPI00094E76F5|nr:PREDICTED: actin cytoskeleton-regulatory complex protein pan1-like [Hippocampus comes]
MEEKELLKERLQAITDKRRIREYIAEKRRRVEEEKLKLQYIKKKALRDQWLMDGLSPQSEEEQEAARLQAQDERQQSDALQSDIDRMEKEIEALETEELHISANEEVVLKRLKEVERTAEDIIKKAASDRSDPASPGGVAVREETEAVALEEGREGLRRNESVASSVSDTLSSAESVCETEAHRRTEQGGDSERRGAPWRDADPPRPLPPSGPEPDAHREPSAALRRFPDEEDEPDRADEGEGDLEEDEERDPEVPGEPSSPPLPPAVMGEEALSDISSESCPDVAPDDADECLRVEIAAASSDSETDEKWRAVFSSSINKEDDDSYLDALHLSARELFVQKVQATDSEDRGDDDGDARPSPPEAEGRPEASSLAPAVPEGEDGRGRAQRDDPGPREPRAHGARDPNRRLPKDFCVIQETTSENVSTEHVDFQSARKQWRAMEEQSNNNKALLPAARRPDPHAGHARMYAPVRNAERADGRAREAEPSAPQFSPCSEDSGLDDSTPRSPDDEAETPPEREGNAPPPAAPSLVITPSPGREPPTDQPEVEPGGPGQRRSEDLVVPEPSNAIVRSASEFSLDRACQPQEKMFPSNPFFKLRSRSSVSLVDEEIRVVRRREEELRKDRARLYGHARPADKRMLLSNNSATLSLDRPASSPMKCKSSPSSPMKTPKMDRSTLSCDHRFPEGCVAGRRKSAMALRWEAGHFTKND